MKDLKHIHYYEKLLEETANELVLQEKEAGGIAAGYTCYYVPEVLLNCGKAFSVRLRAPNTGSLDISQYYMSSFICGYTRALFERAFEGGMNYLDFYASSDTCQQMVRVIENIRDLVREYSGHAGRIRDPYSRHRPRVCGQRLRPACHSHAGIR